MIVLVMGAIGQLSQFYMVTHAELEAEAREMKPVQTEERLVSSLIAKQLRDEEFVSVRDAVSDYHDKIQPKANQCCSAVVQRVRAPLSLVWSLVRRFDKPQTYKHFVRSCHVQQEEQSEKQGQEGAIAVGSIRHVDVVSGLPAASSTERLERLDDQRHVISFSILGGEHRLQNYRSTTSLHELRRLPDASGASPTDTAAGAAYTLVIESYVVDVPSGNTREDTSLFVDTIVKCNLQSLSRVSERLAGVSPTASPRSLPSSPGPRK